MALPRLFLACLAIVVALTASSVSAAGCPGERQYSGSMTPGSTATVSVTTSAKGDTYFIFMPQWCSGMNGLQTVTMSVRGNSMTGDCGLGIALTQASAGTYLVQLEGKYLHVDGLAVLPFTLYVYQSHCTA
jgi:hypothetical protein